MTETKPSKPCLPFGWIVKQSHSYPDRVYFFNTITGATTWAMPALDKDDQLFEPVSPRKHRPLPKESFASKTVLISGESVSDPGNYSNLFSPPLNSPTKRPQKASIKHSQHLSSKKLPKNPNSENDTAHRSSHRNSVTELLFGDCGNDACFSPEPESDNSVVNVIETDEDDYTIDLESSSVVKIPCLGRTKNSPIHISDGACGSSNHLRLPHKDLRTCNSDPCHDKNRRLKKTDTTKTDSDCEIIDHGCKSNPVSKDTVCNFQKHRSKKSLQKVNSTCDVKGYEGRKKRKIIDSVGALLSNLNVPSKKRKVPEKTLIDDPKKLSNSKALEGRKYRKVADSMGALLQRMDKQERTVDPRVKLNAKRKCSEKPQNVENKRQKVAKKVTPAYCESSTSTVISSDQQFEDPQKLKKILSWIDSAEPSTSELTDNIVESDSSPARVEECEDNRRVVLTTGRTFLKAPDSDYSTLTNPTSLTMAAKEKGLMWRGLSGHVPVVENTSREIMPVAENTSREIMGMDIDEVQNHMIEEEEKMVIDDNISLEALKEMRKKLNNNPEEVLGVLTQSVSGENTVTSTSKQTCSQYKAIEKNLNIVVDTNVFMHNLSFIEELKDFSIIGYGKPTLVVPWVVLQELDSLKSNRRSANLHLSFSVERKARLPVHFLQSCLSSQHPRVVGQTPLEAKKVIGTFSPDCNDDRILQCCLQWKNKYPDSVVVLLSNDINLCNKAIVCGIRAYKKKDLLCGLEDIDKTSVIPQQKTCQKKQVNSVCSDQSLEQSRPQVSKNVPALLYDEVYCKMKLLLRESMGPVLQQEMKNIYDDVWLNIVVKKPPWTVKDILDCFKKHWMAVFGFIYKRKLQDNIDRLVVDFCPGKGFTFEASKLKKMLTDAIEVLDEAVSYADYGSQVKDALSQLKKLQSLCCEKKITEWNLPSLESWLENTETEKRPEKKNPELLYMIEKKFQLVWESIQNFCIALEQLSEANNPDLRQTQEAFQILGKLVPILKELRNQYSSLLCVPVSELASKQQLLSGLCQQLNTFFWKLNFEDNSDMIYVLQLQEYISDPEKRPLLMAGLDHLDVMLRQIYNCVKKLPDPQENL